MKLKMAADRIVWRPIAEVKVYAGNPQDHPEDQIEALAKLIAEVGWTQPLVVGKDGELISGHGRLMAAGQLGLAEVPTIDARHLTEDQRRAFRISDNRLAELSGWNRPQLKREARKLLERKADLSLLAFGDRRMAALLEQETPAEGEDDCPDPEAAVSQLGDTWRLGAHRLHCGDSGDAEAAAAALGGAKPHLMVTAPPEGLDLRDSWKPFAGGVAYVWHADPRTAGTVAAGLEACGLLVRAQIAWVKDRAAAGRGHYHGQHETAFYCRGAGKAEHWRTQSTQGTVWRIPAVPKAEREGHGAQKPVECMRRPMRHSSLEGDAVYDPFSGTGSTLIAAELTGRTALCVELDPVYVDIAVKRWQAIAGAEATLDGDGRGWREVVAERGGA